MEFQYKALLIFILSLLCVFSLYSNSAKSSENNKDNDVYKTIYKIRQLREDLIKSFPGSSLEERHRYAADKRKEMGILLSQLLKNRVLQSSEIRELYNEMMQWKGVVNDYTAMFFFASEAGKL